jgi:hypothetical protein
MVPAVTSLKFILPVEKDVRGDFSYPIKSYFEGEGNWTLKDPTGRIQMIKDDLFKDIDAIFAYRIGEHDGDSWIFLGHAPEYYLFIEASCDYTGFSCRGGGTIAIINDWVQMWNLCMNSDSRDYILRENGLPAFQLTV